MDSVLDQHWRESDVVTSDTHIRQLSFHKPHPSVYSSHIDLGPTTGYFYPIIKTVQSADANDTFEE